MKLLLKTSIRLFIASLVWGIFFNYNQITRAEIGHLKDLGSAVNGEKVTLDLDSISKVSYKSVDFIYYLGGNKIFSQANCNNLTWTNFTDNTGPLSPNSTATKKMVILVCDLGL
jgi:hypothetical protein